MIVVMVAPEYLMLHNKFQSHQSMGSREEEFKGFYYILHSGHIGHVTLTFEHIFFSSTPGGSETLLQLT